MKNTLALLIFVATAVVVQSCKLPEAKPAKFTRDQEEIIAELKTIGNFESAAIKSSASNINGKTTRSVVIELTNAADVPAGEEVENLARSAAGVVARALENKSDYDDIRVEIVNSASLGVVQGQMKSNYNFPIADFK